MIPSGPIPRAGLEVYKGHGLGNDYLVVEAGGDWELTAEAVRAVCHRTRGAGGDGIVWVDSGDAPFRLRMFNPDGSEFERSGNGLRVLASHLHRRRRVGEAPFEVEVGGATVTLQVLGAEGDLYDVAVEMGASRVGPDAVALEPALLEAGDRPGEGFLSAGVDRVRMVPVSVGNPHAVIWGAPDPWSSPDPWGAADAEIDLERMGPAVATHPGFAQGTNVQLAWQEDDRRLHALVWERGVGRTSASGTSACAVAVSAVATGRIPPGEVEVVMEGGVLRVAVDPRLRVRLRGPVEAVFSGRLAPGLTSGPDPGQEEEAGHGE